MRTVPKTCSIDLYYAAECSRWSSSYDVFLYRIQLITKEKLTGRNITIVSVALGLGYGLGANSDILRMLPDTMQLIFGGSGIVPAAIVALVLNIVLPKDEA